MYSIKEIADLAGVTTRTLRYYDQLGLLNPAAVAENGYRLYDRESLLRLQQVLFFKELGVALRDIQSILGRPGFEPLQALEDHRNAIKNRIQRLGQLEKTLDKTITSLGGGYLMRDQELFEGFDETQYEDEARELWGYTNQYQESQKKWTSYSQEEKEHIKQEGSRITRLMVTENPEARPGDPDVQQAVGDYYAYLNTYFYTFEVPFLLNLAEMWVQDPRFKINYERIREGGAAFVRDAVQVYCDSHQD